MNELRKSRFAKSRIAATVSLVGVAALALTGCVASTSGGSGEGDKSLVFVGTGGSYQDAQRTSMLEPFAAEFGVNTLEDSPATWTKMTAQVDANNVTWDVVEALPYFAIGYCGDYLEPIDYDTVDVSDIDPEMVSECGVPNMKTGYLLVYNKDKYGDDGPQSWADFYDTEKFPGTRGMMGNAHDGGYETALMADGVPSDDVYPIDYDRAFAKLDTIKDDTVFFSTGAEMQESLENGSADMIIAWPGRAYAAAANGANLQAVWNQPLFYWDVFVVPKGAPNKETAMEFINYAIQPTPQAEMSELIGYAPIHPDADPDLPEAMEQFVPSGQDDGTGATRDMDWWAENLEEATDLWTSWITG
ncbi:MAG: ABC transporter substrate-binding protein [Leucobacter sp.]